MKMFIINLSLKCIKYIFFLQLLYCNNVLSEEKDYRANPEPRTEVQYKSSIDYSKNFMVVCADKRAAIAAKKILNLGGNAIDAAIAAQNVLSVVEPQSSGLGGGGFLLFYNKKLNVLEAWDGRETSPESSAPHQYIDIEKKKMPFMKALVNPISIGVPGLYTMLFDAHTKNGKVAWNKLFVDAISYAEEFKVSPRLHKMLKWAPHIKNDEYSKKIYYEDEAPKKVGSIVNNIKLARSLKLLSKNGYSINSGKLSDLIQKRVPTLSQKDLKNWKTIQRSALCKKYHEYEICGFPPPTSGGISVLQTLSILENFDTKFDHKKTILDEHLFLEASRLAYADRDVFIADPKFFAVPTEELLSDKYLNQRAALINLKKARTEFRSGSPKSLKIENLNSGINFNIPSTTHISIIDADGNAVALTSSIEFAFGSGKTVGGFFLNNQLTDFSFLSHNQKGIKIANSVEPKKKPRSSMAPTIVFKDDQLVGVLGSPGGSRIICYVSKTLFYLINFNLGIEESIDLPHLCSRNSFSEIEKTDHKSITASELKLLGHDIVKKEMNSGLNIIWKNGNVWGGASDHRREGVAVGF